MRGERGDQPDQRNGRAAWRNGLIDTGLVAVIGGAVLLAAYAASGPGPGVGGVALIAVGSLALIAHRRAPVPVLVVTAACMLGYAVHTEPVTSAAFPVVAGVHAVTRAGHRAAAIAVSVVFLGGFFLASPPGGEGIERTLLLHGWFLSAGVTGLIDKNWQAYLHQTEQRAAEAERTREEAALRRAGEERLRIARELHDSLTHSISIVKLQAGVAVHLARKRGEEVPEALLAIQEASGEAMRELRATLEVLRTDVVPPGTGLARLGELVERARTAGLAASVTVTGPQRPLPGDVDRAAYRIVQEALTNVARHAGRAKTAVRLAYGADHVSIRVEDEGPAAQDGPPVVPGTGLTGMRERVTALGGTLHAAPRPGGGFCVHAELPLEEG
ncbi:sensor histidine kinase [Streptomyces chryseus]|uniref:histidine kinase n=1 Tax=Streptomyces chryseus TaxID=68186 RepID=A0ABQ3DN34_9ACTN|nr:sensor histidine kinase [Streptomyces chryseus]GHB00543.1 two-component sensor histidine kinase [Streptomyces chryseus]